MRSVTRTDTVVDRLSSAVRAGDKWRKVFRCRSGQALHMRSGQAMLESLIAIGLICVIFFGAMQISQMYAAREILHHAAARGARAKTVGFNWWMVRKAIHVAAIPNSGAMISPQIDLSDPVIQAAIEQSKGDGDVIDPWLDVLSGRLVPSSLKYQVEQALIPEYMASENHERARYVLNYESWEDNLIHYEVSAPIASGDGETLYSLTTDVTVWQNYTNWLGLPRTFYNSDTVRLTGVNTLENHYPLYIDDQLW